jgi:phosphohistidine phosphatase SixA
MKKIAAGFLIVLALCTSNAFAQTTVILTRHAEKAANDPKDPDLSESGAVRANALAAFFANQHIDLFYTTPFKRTRQTLEPLAKSKGKAISEYNPAFPQALADAVKAMENKVIVIAGHSNSVPDLVNRISGTTGFPQLDDTSYGDLFIITLLKDHPASVLRVKMP